MIEIVFRKPDSEKFEVLSIRRELLEHCSDMESLAIEIREYLYATLEKNGETVEELDEQISELIFNDGDFWTGVVASVFNKIYFEEKDEEENTDDLW